MLGPIELPILMPWPAGVALMLAGVVLVFLGYRQSRAEFDIDRIPLTSATSKYFWGVAILLLGASQAIGGLFL